MLEDTIDLQLPPEKTEIIKEKLFLGTGTGARKFAQECLDAKENNFLIVCCTNNKYYSDLKLPDKNYYDARGFASMTDEKDEIIPLKIRAQACSDAIELIDKALRENTMVFVHCDEGVERSPTLVMAYLMRQQNLCIEQALAKVKSKRSVINPFSADNSDPRRLREVLQIFQKTLKVRTASAAEKRPKAKIPEAIHNRINETDKYILWPLVGAILITAAIFALPMIWPAATVVGVTLFAHLGLAIIAGAFGGAVAGVLAVLGFNTFKGKISKPVDRTIIQQSTKSDPNDKQSAKSQLSSQAIVSVNNSQQALIAVIELYHKIKNEEIIPGYDGKNIVELRKEFKSMLVNDTNLSANVKALMENPHDRSDIIDLLKKVLGNQYDAFIHDNNLNNCENKIISGAGGSASMAGQSSGDSAHNDAYRLR
jgi:protein-tyrosine phosphatase